MTTEVLDKNIDNKPKQAYRCLLWGFGDSINDNYTTIKYFEYSGQLQIYGITSNTPIFRDLGGYRYISKDDIDISSFDIVLVMAYSRKAIDEISDEAIQLGVPFWNIIPCTVIGKIGFDFDKYRQIKKNPPTIFAPNCWGGITYHQLGLRFDSPFINMYESHDDYLKILADPKHYLACELQFKEMNYDPNLKIDFPVTACDDVLLYFNHYKSFDEANYYWNKRKQRINWDNIFAMYYDEDPARIKKFCDLPYERKICFVPFASELDHVLPVKYRVNEDMEKIPFWKVIIGIANGRYPIYNVLDLLLYGKITPISKLVN